MEKELPPGFIAIRDILDGGQSNGSLVNVIGFATDFRPPISTRGNVSLEMNVKVNLPGVDWKCQVKLVDLSIDDGSSDSLMVNIFRPKDQMPDANCGDVVVIHAGKIQQFHSGIPSLITHWSTHISVYCAKKIPRPPRDASVALVSSSAKPTRQPERLEQLYVSKMFHFQGKSNIPTQSEFQDSRDRALNIKDKFSELCSAGDGIFINTIAEIVRKPYDYGDKFSLWISDYSENKGFFNHAFKGLSGDVPADSYGYTSRFPDSGTSNDSWTGPYGQLSMQITCYEPHAKVIRSLDLTPGSWVHIRNLQIKYGHNGSNLEGFLREDQRYTDKINIFAMNVLDEDPENVDPRLKAAVRRKRDYHVLKKRQLNEIFKAAEAGKKRKSLSDLEQGVKKRNTTTKRKRQAQRAEKLQNNNREDHHDVSAPTESELTTPTQPTIQPSSADIADLNNLVKCDNHSRPPTIIADMLAETQYTETASETTTTTFPLPFSNTNYRSFMRVIDFYPRQLEYFARAKKMHSEFEILSDAGSELSEASNSSDDEELDRIENTSEHKTWEWRFFLKLQDAVVPSGQEKRAIWVAVDNLAAQCLLDLDASNLHQNKALLTELRQRLFILWGDLEEVVSQAAEARERAISAAKKGQRPANSSDDDEADPQFSNSQALAHVKNRPFSCCIRQYGVKVRSSREENVSETDNIYQWRRMFGMFGTRLSD